MGSLYKGICYPTLIDAKNNICSTFSGSSLTVENNVSTYSCSFEYIQNDRMIVFKYLDGIEVGYAKLDWPQVPDCDFAGTSDLAYEWFIIALSFLVVVWGGKQLLKLFDVHHEKD